MTYIAPTEYALPIDVRAGTPFGCPAVDSAAITVVVPVKDDVNGLLRTLRSLASLRIPPRHIRIVDDGSAVPIALPPLHGLSSRVAVVRLPRNRGPAAARNAGVEGLSGWIYLTDCGCEHPADLFERLAEARSRAADETVAVASPVVSEGGGRIGRYMTEQGNLNPPMVDHLPQAVITASVLVHSEAGDAVGWFDTRFREAGGEDIDFGLRLRRLGQVAWCPDAEVRHDFEDSLDDFDRRFRRYGRGMRVLASKWGVPMEPFAFQARSSDLQDLADRQFLRMLEGYRGER